MKVIYSGLFEEYWLKTAQLLSDENGWQPVYWIAMPEAETIIRGRYPDVIFHPLLDAIKGIPAPVYAERLCAPLDQPIIQQNAYTELLLLRMMDRYDALGSFDYNDRVRLLHRLMMYWQTVLDETQPDIVVFTVIPHMIYDYVLHEYCKQRGIRTLMFESTPFLGRTFIMETFESASPAETLYNKLLADPVPDDIFLSDEVENYIHSFKGSYQDAPIYIRRDPKKKLYQGSTSSQKSVLQKLLDFEKYAQYIKKQIRILRARVTVPQNYVKQKHKKLENSQMNFLAYQIFRARSRRRMRQLEQRYKQLAVELDFDQPYIFVALSYQPERTTSPMAGAFVEQYLIVDMLSKAVPKDWKIYVKEHPTQFTPAKYFRAQSGRSLDLYDDLAALPNVQLVPLDISSYDLIDHAQAVAATTGTAGWEALHRGKPVLLFGLPWYRGCEGTFQIDTYESCLSALEKIRTGYALDEQKIRLFVSALEKTAIDVSVEPHLQIKPLTADEKAARLVEAIQEFVAV
ncbi:MAG: hypothetical protein HN413_17310 [Chloroflexi bacterium]|jgi:hypothetical protein|nr:hypothetical protein [Chloroflexota bacterium]